MSSTVVDRDLFPRLRRRGLVQQVTDDALAARLAAKPLTLYAGFDPTSDSLHIGSLMPIMMLRRFQSAGHHPIAVVGGATGMIGDPSGKAAERSLLSKEQLDANLEGIKKVISRFVALDGPQPLRILNNADWTGMSYLDFLRDIGKHFTVNYMMAKDSVRERLENRDQGISYTEFSYMLLQAYDFYVLNRDCGCELQVGGSDQWGNITAGTELIRKMATGRGGPASAGGVYGMTFPLVTKADGGKFGKSEKGNIWLEARYTSPYRFYQFFVQTADADVMRYLHYFTELSDAALGELEAAVQSRPEGRQAQQALAREVTRLVHGETELQRAESATQAFFGGDLRTIDAETLREVVADIPSLKKARGDLDAGLPLLDALAEAKLCDSKGMARKDVQAGGVYVNSQRVTDPSRKLTAADLLAGVCIVLRKGKKTYATVSFD
jgi:tyrosyl-tRNA synthetase